MSDKTAWIKHLENAIKEMKEKYVILLKRGDLIKEDQMPLYKKTIEELEAVHWFLFMQGGSTDYVYRHLTMNLFMKYESFFMDLFETNEFPQLFELFELE